MLTSTIYEVTVRYNVDKRGADGVKRVKDEVDKLASSTGGASDMFGKLGAVIVGYFGASQAYKALIGFNATVEDTKNQIAGMLALTKKTDLSDQLATADKLFSNLQKRAAKLPGTTQEYTTMAGMLAQPISDAGLGMKALEDITVNTVVGAKALRVEAGAAARDVDQALRGQFHSTDAFTGKILGSVGFKGEEGRKKYNQMSAEARADTLRQALTQKQITQLAEAQGATFNGVLSTLQDAAEQFFGKVGLPLFQAITNEIKGWNSWLDKNSDVVDRWAKQLGTSLVDGFRVVRSALGFLVDHADTLLMIGKVWAGIKIAGIGSDLLAGSVGPGGARRGGLLGAADSAGGAIHGFFDRSTADPHTGALAGRAWGKASAGDIPLLAQVFAGSYALGTAFNEATNSSKHMSDALDNLFGRSGTSQKLRDSAERLGIAFDNLEAHVKDAAVGGRNQIQANLVGLAGTQYGNANTIRDALKLGDGLGHDIALARLAKAGLGESDLSEEAARRYQSEGDRITAKSTFVGGVGWLSLNAGISQLTEYQKQTLDMEKAQTDLLGYLNRTVSDHGVIDPGQILSILRNDTEDPSGKHKPAANKPNVNITIQRIEVQSDDPDRYAFGLVNAFRDAVKNPSQAVRALREG